MLKRKIESYLNDWKQNRKTALLIKGARQIGKTYSIDNFVDNNFENVIKINFAIRTDLINSFVEISNSDQLLIRLSATFGDKMVPGKTIFFFDEIQLLYEARQQLKDNNQLRFDCQDLLTALKPMVIEGQYRFVLSGSLLGTTLNNVVLNPTGYLDIKTMYPLDFEEYLWSKGVGQNAIEYVKNCFFAKKEVDDPINDQFIQYFNEYILIGGMPEAINNFKDTKNLYLVSETLRQINSQYLLDITKYISDPVKRLRIREVYNAIGSELNNKNKRFIASHIFDRNQLRNINLIDEYLWLTNAGIAIPVFNVDNLEMPLALAVDRKTIKIFMNDIGLLDNSLLETGIREKILDNNLEVNYGAPYENVCAQELLAHGFEEKLFYYNSKKHGEVDFVIEYQNNVLPIEIKSGKPNEMNVFNHSTLNNLIEIYDMKEAYVFGKTNYYKENDIIHQFPIYMISFISNDR